MKFLNVSKISPYIHFKNLWKNRFDLNYNWISAYGYGTQGLNLSTSDVTRWRDLRDESLNIDAVLFVLKKNMLLREKSKCNYISFNDSAWFHQHIYSKLLCSKIPKGQRNWWFDYIFCTLGIYTGKSCT